MTDFMSQRELGTLFGVSSHAIGKWLVECGLRTDERKPSSKAFDGGYVKQAPTGRNDGYFYVWHQRKTLAGQRQVWWFDFSRAAFLAVRF